MEDYTLGVIVLIVEPVLYFQIKLKCQKALGIKNHK